MNSAMKELLDAAQEAFDWIDASFRDDEKPKDMISRLRVAIHTAKTEPWDGPRIIIEVSGGNVQAVKADVDELQIDVLDYDNREAMEKASEIDDFEKLEAEYEKLECQIL